EIPEALNYYLDATGMTREEFFRIMEEKKLPQVKRIELPIVEKTRKNRERILPFSQQLIEREENGSE
ncbi:MAG TPA: hypothetical protein VNC11_08465, partial [Gemmatimonadaceae bacterium]|nr:hypothetical protein [Gemmatimonadaceae bacterium]